MLAVQTLNLHKYYNSNDISSIRLQLIMALLSSYLLKKQYDRVILYCDEKTALTLSNSYYNEIRILPNNILVENGYGTLSKLFTYSNVEAEYIHFDIDYFLFNKIELENEIICGYSETREKCGEQQFNLGYSSLIDKLKLNYNEFGFNIINENYAMNVCVFGIPKIYHKQVTEYFKGLDEYTQQNIKSIVNTHSTDAPPHWAIEQYLPAQLFLENEFKIKELNEYENVLIKGDRGYLRIYEMKEFSNIANFRIEDIDIKKSLSKYMQENVGHHLWISKKVAGMDKLLINIIEEMYPELYEKINSILNIKDTKNKKLI
jgi:hypothetical protein